MHLATNGGLLVTIKKADVLQWREVWFNVTAITNIFSYAEMIDKYRITYDSEKEDTFLVHLPNKLIQIERIGNNLHVYRPPNTATGKQIQLLNTVEENESFYTHRQFERAKSARDLYHALGTPSVPDFKAMLWQNNPVTIEDIMLAETIFGPDIGALKGKTTRCKPTSVVHNYIEIPKELITSQSNATLCIDVIKVNGLVLLISESRIYSTEQLIS
jgi:hypothetical protein